MDDLALKVSEIDDIEIDDAKLAYSRGAEIQRQRGTESTRADAKHLRGFEFLLPLERDLGHDQMPAVSQNLIVIQFDGARGGFVNNRNASGDRRHDAHRVAVLERRRMFFRVSNVFVVDIDIDEVPQRAFVV